MIGYTAKHILTPKHKTFKTLIAFLYEHYAKRKPSAAKKKEEKIQKEQFQAMMLWNSVSVTWANSLTESRTCLTKRKEPLEQTGT